MTRYWYGILAVALVATMLLGAGCAPAATPTAAPAATAVKAQPTTPPAAAPTATPTKAPEAAPTGAPTKAAEAPYPNRAITIIAGAGPGGGTDVFARAISIPMGGILKQSFIVQNMGGGSGSVGQSYVAKQPADGYTLLAISSDLFINSAYKRGDTTYKDFTPVARVQYDQGVLWVRAESPFKTIQEVIADAKANPEKQKWGMTYAGAFDDTLLGLFVDSAGVKVNFVPYQSGSETLAAVLGGHVDVYYEEPASAWASYEAKKLRPLVVFTENRLPLFADVPTAKELGYDVTLGIIRGFYVKKGTPPEIVKTLEAAIQKAMADPVYKAVEHQTMLDMRPGFLNAADFAKFMETEYALYHKTLLKLGYIKD